MIISRSVILINLIAVASAWAIWEYRVSTSAKDQENAGPDVIVGDLTGVSRFGPVGDSTAFSIGTVSCNIGTSPLAWISSSNQHPVITQNLYRIKDGRIEMIGMAWLKHGFTALQQSLCGSCTPSGSGSWLGVGCSDPYSASLNGQQSGLGPRSEVNATTGVFAWPRGSLPSNPGTLGGRIRVFNSDLNPSLNAGARYFAESQYVAPDDAAAGNGTNNASYREVTVLPATGGWTIAFGTPQTVRMQSAIFAWKAVHPDVKIFTVDVPNDGRIFVGLRTTPIAKGGGFHTEFAVSNMNSHQSVRSLGVRFGSGGVFNPGFKDIDYQFEPYSGADWTPIIVGNEIDWSTQTFAQNPNANAIRWNTLYSFWCDSELPPRQLTLGMFRPGTVSEMNIDLVEAVVPASHSLAGAAATNGQFSNVFSSNNQYFELTPLVTKRLPYAQFDIQANSPTATPTNFGFRLEAKMKGLPYGEVDQVIELFNYLTGQYEVVDERIAETSDHPLEIMPTGDLRRFVQNGTNQVSARIVWNYIVVNGRNPYSWSIDIDESVWLVGQ
jgi:hypothetical protein